MWLIGLLALVASAYAQIPSLGWCPDYQPLANFNINRFLGSWHEAERYFTVSELGSRCVTTTYEMMPDSRVWVTNEIKNSFTGVKRVLDGTLQMTGREGEGKVLVKYTNLPLPYDTEYYVLDTDYDSFAVVWSCSGIGPLHTQNAWILTRERLAPNLVLQKAYTVLERFKIARAFFVKTYQEDCSVIPDPISPENLNADKQIEEAVYGADEEKSINAPTPVVNPAPVEKSSEPVAKEEQAVKSSIPEAPQVVPEVAKSIEPQVKAAIPVPELILAQAEKEKPTEEKPAESESKPEIKAGEPLAVPEEKLKQ